MKHTDNGSPQQFRLSQARLSDFETVASLFEALHIYNASLDEHFALAENWYTLLHDYFERTCDDPQMLWLLAWGSPLPLESQPAGLLIVKTHTDSALFRYRHWAELVAIYVSPPWRGTHLARHLLAYAHDWTASHSQDRLQLYVTATNERARQFYRSCGLRPVQEIWRLDVEPTSAVAALQEEHPASDDDLLDSGHHYLDDDAGPERPER